MRTFDFSLKNIPIPNEGQYMKAIIHKTETFITRLRWKALFFLRREKMEEDDDEGEETQRETFGFKSSKPPPPIKETMAFEKDLWQLIASTQFSDRRQPFQRKLRKDLSHIKKSNDIFVHADKTRNLYQMKPSTYKQLIADSATKNYRKIDAKTVNCINHEAKTLAESLKLADRIESIPEAEAFITLKDHKQNFTHQPQCRLINPTKTEMGIISQGILQRINASIRQKTKLTQWRNTGEAVSWFQGLTDKENLEFLQCDIVDFYPSITEDLLNKALQFASEHTTVTTQDKEILYHARQTVLFANGASWAKKDSLFDVSMGAYDGAEVAELVGLLILNTIKDKLPKLNFGLYRDDGLAAYKTSRGIHIDKMRKKLTQIFTSHGLNITATFRLHNVNFLDVNFDLATDAYRPYRKPNDNPLYIHTHSNHPPHITKQLPNMIGNRLSAISSSAAAFAEAAPEYNAALQKSGYKEEVHFTPPTNHHPPKQNTPQPPTPYQTPPPQCSQRGRPPRTTQGSGSKKSRKRKRDILWYNPPFNAAVTTNIGKRFLGLIDTHFPKSRPDKLYKIFNRHLIKLSYSCTPNIKSIITAHNTKTLAKTEQNQTKHTNTEKACNCRNKEECPLRGDCQQQTVVYKATISTTACTRTYIGSTENTFKQRFYGHKADMNNTHKRYNTTLAHYIWECKDKGEIPTVTWEVLKKCCKYKRGSRRCDLCLTEKLMILRDRDNNLLNKRSELMGRCPHQRKWKLQNMKPG